MVRALRILVVEDSQEDIEQLRQTLRAGDIDATLHVVTRVVDLEHVRSAPPWDLVVSDDRLPDGDALAVLERVRRDEEDRPVIVLSGSVGEPRAVELISAGVDDVVLKEQMGRLPTAVRRQMRGYHERRLRRAAEAALNRSEHELREVIDAAPVGICICHGDTIAYANRALVACYEGDPSGAGLVGQPVTVLARDGARPLLLERFHAPQASPTEFPFARHDRTVGTMELSGARQLTFGGLPSVLLTLRDVTDERKLRERLQMADRMAAIGTLAAGIAHEINNPLACVTANLEVLREELATAQPGAFRMEPSDVLAAVDDARQGAERVRVIVRDLKLFARVDGSPRRGPVDLAAVLATAERMTASLLRGRAKLTQTHEGGGSLPHVWGDALDLCQVFVNLLANAAQAIEPGDVDSNAVLVRVVPEDGRVAVEIHDTGAGVPEALRSRIFDAFFTTKGAGGGQGLGLSVCHGIVSALGGDITVREGSGGRGTVVTVALPTWTGNTSTSLSG